MLTIAVLQNVTKGQIGECVRGGCDTLNGIKSSTKAGTGCGGCMPLVTNIFKSEMKKSGKELSAALCPHFNLSRADLFNVIQCASSLSAVFFFVPHR